MKLTLIEAYEKRAQLIRIEESLIDLRHEESNRTDFDFPPEINAVITTISNQRKQLEKFIAPLEEETQKLEKERQKILNTIIDIS